MKIYKKNSIYYTELQQITEAVKEGVITKERVYARLLEYQEMLSFPDWYIPNSVDDNYYEQTALAHADYLHLPRTHCYSKRYQYE